MTIEQARRTYMTDFFSTEAGGMASLAKQFFEGALTLDSAQRDKGLILFRPTLALAGQGLELMLKACVYLNGQTPPTKGKKGHDISHLWNLDICKPVRDHVFANATLVADQDRVSGAYADVPEKEKILPLITEYVIDLGKLHGETPYVLRYPAAETQVAPRTPLLVKSLWRTSDDFVKRPDEFILSNLNVSV